jgi:hypothetical protein
MPKIEVRFQDFLAGIFRGAWSELHEVASTGAFAKAGVFLGIAISLLISGFKAGDGGVGCNNGVNYYERFLIFSLQRKTGKERHVCASNVVPEFLPPLVQSPPEVCKTRDQVCEVNENRH